MSKDSQEMNISDDAQCSYYFKKYKKRPSCPFCGARMHFTSNIFYEGRSAYWGCPECCCILSNREDFTEEDRKAARTSMRKRLQQEIELLELQIQYLKERLKLWGKYMSDQEKVKLFAEALEG